MHLYLIHATTGAVHATKQLTVTASLPAKGIGPLAETGLRGRAGH